MTGTAELMTGLESRAEIESLEGLHEQRRAILREYAMLRALHGSNGCWDAKRKQLLEALKIKARLGCDERKEKATEGYVDALAHADTQYEQFIDRSITEKVRYVELETEVGEIEERIRNREVSLLAYNSEVRLGR